METKATIRLNRSVGHYLVDGASAARLRTTLALAARTLGFPIAMVNILDSEIQHTLCCVGAARPPSMPRRETLCDVVVRSGGPIAVDDAILHPEFAELPAVVAGDVGSYIGVPLTGRESLVIGSMCVFDSRSRPVTPGQVAALVEFGKIVDDQLDLIRRLNHNRGHGQRRTSDLANAIASGEIVPWYQPVINLASGHTIGYESLARWEHPSGLVETPGNFVPLAEDSELIIDLDIAVLRRALQDLGHWQMIDPTARVSVNMSGRHFDHDGWVAQLHAAAQEADVATESVYLELTETAQLSRNSNSDAQIAQLRKDGFGLLLDDFGTGWSSLEYLLRLHVHGVKIDQVVSSTIGTPIGDALVRAVAGLARELGLTTTIEGIETQVQADRARELGCDYGQGYLWSAAVPGAVIEERLRLAAGRSVKGTLATTLRPTVRAAPPLPARSRRACGRRRCE